MKSITVLLLCSSLFAIASAQVKLEVSSGSNKNWIAVRVLNSAVATSSVEIKQSTASSWTKMTFEATGMNAGYYTYNDWSKTTGFGVPLSFRLTGSNGGSITLNSVVSAFPGTAQTIDSKTQYVASSSTTGTTKAPAKAATTAPTSKATTKPATGTTKAAATAKPASNSGSSSSSGSGCSAAPKLMVPLYVYPGAAWDAVVAGASKVKTLAIVNPNSGPGGAPDSSYVTYMNKLNSAGVEMVGYVHTSYGARSLADVKKDIDVYANQWPLLKGIFLDEGANDAGNVAYYKNLYDYILGKSGWKYDIINPGVIPDAGYMNAATQIVTLEDYGTTVGGAKVPSYGSCANKEKFAAIVHTVASGSLASIIDGIRNKQYFGYIYVTDGAGGCCTYNSLASYYTSMATYIASKK